MKKPNYGKTSSIPQFAQRRRTELVPGGNGSIFAVRLKLVS